MATILFDPRYNFYLKNGAGTVYGLTSLQSLQALHVVDGGVGQLSATFADPNFATYNAVQPHVMNAAQLQLYNRSGLLANAWTGSVDEAHTLSDPTQGQLLQIKATSPWKFFETTRMTPADVQNLAVLYATNIPASAVILAAAAACGFPASAVYIDPAANAASGYQFTALQTAFLDPDEQTWSAVLQAIIANTGTELFFTPDGRLIWRQPGFLNVPAQPNTVQLAELFAADLAESDTGVVTSIEVRWFNMPYATAKTWDAPAVMKQHLSVARVPTRHLVVQANWITTPDAAQSLANLLGMQYSATLLRGSVTMLADPCYAPGTVCAVPSLIDPTQVTLYYIASVSYNLVYGSAWTMTLGLTYGRAQDQSFPYIGQLAYPSRINPAGANGGTTPTDPTNPARLSLTFTTTYNSALGATTVVADPLLLAPGTVVKLRDASGNPIAGPSPNGEYTVVAGTSGSGQTLGLNMHTPASGVIVNVIAPAAPSPPTTTSAKVAGGTVTVAAATTGKLGGNLATPTAFAAQPVSGAVITQPYGPTGFIAELPLNGYAHFHTGIDLSGLPVNAPIVPAFSGTVSFAAWDSTGYGWAIRVTAGHWTALYGHTGSTAVSGIAVQLGQQVVAGQTTLGTVGSSGKSTGPHLHFELDVDGVPTDPTALYLAAAQNG